MTPDPTLNKTEVWIAEHSIRILLVCAVVILVGAYFVVSTFLESGKTAHEVDVLKPQVTKIYAAAAACAPKTIAKEGGEERCSRLLTVALRNCRHVAKCRAAFLAILTYPPPARSTAPSSTTAPSSEGGDAVHQPSHQGHQQPGPSGGQQEGGGDNGREGGQEAAPAPSPGASAPAVPEGGPLAETPGNGAQGGQGGSSPSGVGVEVCAELVNTCVGAEVGLGR